MTRLKLLKKARKLIKNFDRWTDGPEAIDKRGREVDPDGRKAVAWCAVGALAAYDDTFVTMRAEEVLDEFAKKMFDYAGVISLNEDRRVSRRKRHKRVLKVYKAAIKSLS